MGDLFSGPQIDTSGVDSAYQAGLKATKNLKPVNIRAGGLASTFKNGTVGIQSTKNRKGLVGGISNTFGTQADEIANLRGLVAPGMSELRRTRLQEIENARQNAVGDLRDNLARRRVGGSSFAGDALNRAELTFGQAKDKVAADSFLQELDLTHKLIGEEYDNRRKVFSTKVDELNLQADVATKLASDASNVLTAGAQIQAQLAAAKISAESSMASNQAQLDAGAQSGAGSLFGTILGLGTGGGSTVGGSLLSSFA